MFLVFLTLPRQYSRAKNKNSLYSAAKDFQFVVRIQFFRVGQLYYLHPDCFRGGGAIETNRKPVCLWVLFDGVENSVFESQVLRVAGEQAGSRKFGKVVILSFQSDLSKAKELLSKLELPDEVEFVFHRKLPFFGTLSLESCIDGVSNEIFKTFPNTIIARGPVAGYVCAKALGKVRDEKELLKNKKDLPELIIQARGLLAKEYEYVNRASQWNPFLFPVRWFIKKQLESVEKTAYGEKHLGKLPFSVKIQSVTQSLSDYLVEEFGASPRRLSVSKTDVVQPLSSDQVKKYRKESRSQLGLNQTDKVYCYVGSAKAWQCPEETVDFFCKKRAEDKFAHLLVISQDKESFDKIIKGKGLEPDAYTLVTAKSQKELYKILSAADIGILLREDHPINWVSRPTKVLDYLACGLKVEHNSTVSWVVDQLSIKPAKLEAPKTKAKVVKAVSAKAATKVTAAKKTPAKSTAKAKATKAATKAVKKTSTKAVAKPAKKTTTKTTAKKKTVVSKAKTVRKRTRGQSQIS